MRDLPDAGYDDAPNDEPEGGVKWTLEKVEAFFTQTGFVARFLRNGKPVGMARVESEGEYKWLASRIEGTFDPESSEFGKEP